MVRIVSKYKINDIVEGKITGIENYGIFLAVDHSYTGLIHISEISDSYVKNISDYVSLNEKIKAKIIEVDEKNKKLKLSIKNLNYNDEEIPFVDSKKNGFTSLKNNLKTWIDEKIAEINKE